MRTITRVLSFLTAALALCTALPAGVGAAPTAAEISGEIERLTLNNATDVYSGGVMIVGGTQVILPKNLLLDLPANRLTLQQLFDQAPAACKANGESGLAKSDRCNTMGAGGFATLSGVHSTAGNVIAGDVLIEKGKETAFGVVSYISYSDGYFRLNGTPGDANTGVMIRLNDPTSKHTVQQGLGCSAGAANCSPDPRFGLDPDNYVNTFSTGYPLCIPSTVTRQFPGLPAISGVPAIAARPTAANASGAGDLLCPSTNRTPGVVVEPDVADSRRFAPIMLGDSVKSEGNYESVNGVRFLSAHTTRINRALSTKALPDHPDYLFLEEVFLEAPGFQNQRARMLIIGFATLANPATDVDFWTIHRDPLTNAPHEFPLASIQGCDTAAGAGACSSQGLIGAGGNIFRIRYDVDFLLAVNDTKGRYPGGARNDLNPCWQLLNSPRFNASNPGLCPGAVANTLDGAGITLANNFGIMEPAPHEIQARTGHLLDNPGLAGKTIDINGAVSTNGQYLFPFGINLGGTETADFLEVDINLLDTPRIFEGLPWNLDRRLAPSGCLRAGGCEAAPQPLDPFPYTGLDPRTQADFLVAGQAGGTPRGPFNDPNYTRSLLSNASNRVFSYVSSTPVGGKFNFDGNNTLLGCATGNCPADPALIPITAIPFLSIFPPIADEDAASTRAGVPVNIDVLANDVAMLGTIDPTSVKISFGPTNGTAVVNPLTGVITYTPTLAATGTVTLAYTVANSVGAVSAPGAVSITILAPPVAVNDSASVPAKGSLSINVAGNDLSGTGILNLASVAVTTAPNCGSVVNQLDGVILYTAPLTVPAGGTCNFRYTISDASVPAMISNIATVTLNITPPEAPVAVADTATTTTGSQLTIAVLANDTSAASPLNPASLAIGAPTGGTATANANGTVSYTAPATPGSYSFSYTVKNSSAIPTVSNTATATVTVTQGHIAPTAVNDTATGTTGNVTVIPVLANDTASAPSALNPASLTVTTPTGGTAAATSTGTINYTAPGTPGTYSFSYTVKDNFAPAAASNSATVTVTVTASAAVPTGTIVINGGAALTKSTAVTLALTATSSNGPVTQMQFNKDGGAFSALETFAATRAVTLLSGTGPHTIGVRFSDSAGKLSATISASITLDTTPPTGTLSINGGAALTGSALVNLAMTASDLNGVSSMQFSNDGINFFTPVPMAASATLNLLPGDGLRTMLVRYIDAAGNVSAPVSSSITVSTAPPTGSIQIAGAPLTKNSTLTLNLSATSALSTVTQMQLSKDGGATYSALESYVPTRVLLPMPDGLQTIAVRFKDALGNLSQPYTASITIDSTGPTGSIVINGGASVTNAAPPTVTLTAADPAGVSQMQFSKDGGATWSPLEPFVSPKLLLPLSTPDGVKTIGVRYTDTLGNLSPMFSSSIILDTTGPSGSILINGGAATTTSTTVTLTLSASDPAGVTQMQLSKDGAPFSAPEPYLTTRTLLPFASTGLHTVDVKFLDALGNVSQSFQASITIL
jgi:hypothetical protein